VYDPLDPAFVEHPPHRTRVTDVRLHNRYLAGLLDERRVSAFQFGGVIVVEIIDHYDSLASAAESSNQVRTYESRAAGHKY
jgi:hypothetical protein